LLDAAAIKHWPADKVKHWPIAAEKMFEELGTELLYAFHIGMFNHLPC
jgi:hypothetical protein